MLFFELSSDELTILASLVTLGFSKGLTADQMNILGNFLAAVGTLMTTIAAKEQALTTIEQKKQQEQEKQSDDTQQQIKELQEKIQQILEEKNGR